MANHMDKDLFGNPVEAQPDLFGAPPARPKPRPPRAEYVRNSLRSFQREMERQDPAEIDGWYRARWIENQRGKLDYFCDLLPDEAARWRAAIEPLIDDLARRFGLDN